MTKSDANCIWLTACRPFSVNLEMSNNLRKNVCERARVCGDRSWRVSGDFMNFISIYDDTQHIVATNASHENGCNWVNRVGLAIIRWIICTEHSLAESLFAALWQIKGRISHEILFDANAKRSEQNKVKWWNHDVNGKHCTWPFGNMCSLHFSFLTMNISKHGNTRVECAVCTVQQRCAPDVNKLFTLAV